MADEDFCDEFHLVDLRVFDNCAKVRWGQLSGKERPLLWG